MNYNWFYTEGDLSMLCNPDGSINWNSFGFTTDGVRWAVANGYQTQNADGVTVSMFPIENESIFRETLGAYIEELECQTVEQSEGLAPWVSSATNRVCKVISQEECDSIHAELMAIAETRMAEAANTPTAEDIYKAQQLLLLTEISNGLAEMKDSDTAV